MDKKLRNVKKLLNNAQIPWAVSGSMAMKLYGNKYGVNLGGRTPANLDIVVNRNNVRNAYTYLYNKANKNNRRPFATISRSNRKNRFDLSPFDILVAKSALAPNIDEYVNINGVPTVPFNKLIQYKRAILSNIPNKKAENNLKLLEKIQLKKIKNVIIQRIKKSFVSPPRKSPSSSRSPNRSPSSYRTPSPRKSPSSSRSPSSYITP